MLENTERDNQHKTQDEDKHKIKLTNWNSYNQREAMKKKEYF